MTKQVGAVAQKTEPLRTGTQRKIRQDSFNRKLDALVGRFAYQIINTINIPATTTNRCAVKINLEEFQNEILALAKKVY